MSTPDLLSCGSSSLSAIFLSPDNMRDTIDTYLYCWCLSPLFFIYLSIYMLVILQLLICSTHSIHLVILFYLYILFLCPFLSSSQQLSLSILPFVSMFFFYLLICSCLSKSIFIYLPLSFLPFTLEKNTRHPPPPSSASNNNKVTCAHPCARRRRHLGNGVAWEQLIPIDQQLSFPKLLA